MRRSVRSAWMEEFEVFEYHEMHPHEDCMHFDDKFSTLQLLYSFLNDYFAMHTFRAMLCHGMDYADLGGMNDNQVLDRIADRLVSGHLKMVRKEVHMRGGWSAAKTEEEEEERPLDTAVIEEKTWIEIKLVDETGDPLKDEHFEIELRDGSIKTGTTDSSGTARLHGMDPGTCQVRFQRLDKEAWGKTN